MLVKMSMQGMSKFKVSICFVALCVSLVSSFRVERRNDEKTQDLANRQRAGKCKRIEPVIYVNILSLVFTYSFLHVSNCYISGKTIINHN